MTQLAPLEAYREGILAISTARLGLLTGLLFALLFCPGMAAVSLWAKPRWVAADGPLPGLLEVESALGAWRLSVPRPAQVLAKIREVVGSRAGSV